MAKILLIEDENLICDFIADELKACGYEVASALTFEAATQLITDDLSLLITDIYIKDSTTDGWQFAKDLRTRISDIPIIYMTGFSYNGVDALPNSLFIKKPYSINNLLNSASLLISNKGS